jgi:predicted alpha/beta superfamily hydrolase
MGDNKIFQSSYNSTDGILTGTVLLKSVDKDDSKKIFELMSQGINENASYTDYILDTRNVTDIKLESFGYLMKAQSIVKKTAGYMVLVVTDESLQKFMVIYPEMFDYYAVFFNTEDARKFIISKR